jgi:hypothetical protein
MRVAGFVGYGQQVWMRHPFRAAGCLKNHLFPRRFVSTNSVWVLSVLFLLPQLCSRHGGHNVWSGTPQLNPRKLEDEFFAAVRKYLAPPFALWRVYLLSLSYF